MAAGRANDWWLWAAIAGGMYLLYKGATSTNIGVDIVNSISPGAWATMGTAPQYTPYIAQVEQQYGLPSGLLARIAYQESHFDPSAYNPASGATGMFQLEPAYYPQAGQNWQNDAVSAARSLVSYFHEFDDWQLAVAAYDDGPGNIAQYLNGTRALPTETRNYITKVFTDVPIQGSLFDPATQQLTV